MASRIGRFSALAILVWSGSTPAQATTFAEVSCLGVVTTGNGFADCLQGKYYGTSPGIEVPGSGEAHADLYTGVLRSRSSAAGERSGTNPADAQGSRGYSTAEFSDTITIGGGYSGPVQISMDVSGIFRLSAVPYGSRWSGAADPMGMPALSVFDPNSNSDRSGAEVFVRQDAGEFLVYVDYASVVGDGSFSTNANSLGQFADPTDVRIVLTGTFMVTPTTPTFSFLARLVTNTAIGSPGSSPGDTRVSEVDFGNSAHLSMILPAGVPWTSESGVFLQGVPEPATGALLAAGVLCLSVVGRLRPRIGGVGSASSSPSGRAGLDGTFIPGRRMPA
jgi:hypothetical protein